MESNAKSLIAQFNSVSPNQVAHRPTSKPIKTPPPKPLPKKPNAEHPSAGNSRPQTVNSEKSSLKSPPVLPVAAQRTTQKPPAAVARQNVSPSPANNQQSYEEDEDDEEIYTDCCSAPSTTPNCQPVSSKPSISRPVLAIDSRPTSRTTQLENNLSTKSLAPSPKERSQQTGPARLVHAGRKTYRLLQPPAPSTSRPPAKPARKPPLMLNMTAFSQRPATRNSHSVEEEIYDDITLSPG